jgi:glucose-1-phosphate adenylyltransferase
MHINDDWRVTEFIEKPADPPSIPGQPDLALASMGIYVFNAPFLYEQLARDTITPASSHDLGRDLIPHMVPRYRVYAQRFDDSCVGQQDKAAYWRDVGTVDAYWESNMDLTRVTPDLNMYDKEWPIWTHQEQLPPAKFVFDDEGRRGGAVDSVVSGGCLISGTTVKRSLLFSNVRVHSYGSIEDSVILPDVVVNRQVKLRRTVVDKSCVLPEGLTAGFNAEEDRRRFHVSERGVTLITPEMLGQEVFHQR